MRALVIQNCETESIGRYERYLLDNGIPHDTVHAYRSDDLPPHEPYDAFIVGGTPISANEADQHPFLSKECRYLEEILRSQKPCLGICCGGQLLAQLLGARVVRNPVMEIGGYELRLTAEGARDPILAGFPLRFPAFQWHQDVFEIPSGAQCLVEGESCRNQMFRLGGAIGSIFHLELDEADARRWVDAYEPELARVGKTREKVIAECARGEAQMATLAARLMDNLLGLL